QAGGLLPVAGLADHLDVFLGIEQGPEPGPDQGLIVGQQHPDHRAPLIGNRARTRKPPPGRGPASSPPPSRGPRSPTPGVPLPLAGFWRAAGPRPSSSTCTVTSSAP